MSTVVGYRLGKVVAVGDAGADGDLTEMADVVIVGTVLGDALAAGLRRIAQEAESFRRFPLPDGTPLEQDPTC